MKSMVRESRKKWKNYVDDQEANPLQYFQPSSLGQLVEILTEAENKSYHVKAIGSGHSSSDIALTRDFMIDTHALCQVLDNSQLNLRDPAGSAGLFFAEAGITIRELNKALDARKKALFNMGAYDGQTLAGVISTSTHGSGITLGAFPDYVEAMLLVGEGGRLYQVERGGARAISDGPARLAGDPTIRLVRDDAVFNTLAVSLGCLGILYAIVLRVRESYELKETRHFSDWSQVRAELREGRVLTGNRHYEVLINPYPFSKNERKCMVTKRNVNETETASRFRRGHRKWYCVALLAILPNIFIDWVVRVIVNHFPKATPGFIQLSIATLTDSNYIAKSFKVLNLGKANNLAAFGMEIAFPSHYYLDAVEAILQIVADSRRDGGQYLTGPVSLRFVRTNPFFLSMQYGRSEDDFVCMIEFPTISGAIGGIELLARIESAMYAYGGKPHWGQINHVGGNGHSSLSALYERWPDWLGVYRQFCRLGTFENEFTRRCGISARPEGESTSSGESTSPAERW